MRHGGAVARHDGSSIVAVSGGFSASRLWQGKYVTTSTDGSTDEYANGATVGKRPQMVAGGDRSSRQRTQTMSAIGKWKLLTLERNSTTVTRFSMMVQRKLVNIFKIFDDDVVEVVIIYALFPYNDDF